MDENLTRENVVDRLAALGLVQPPAAARPFPPQPYAFKVVAGGAALLAKQPTTPKRKLLLETEASCARAAAASPRLRGAVPSLAYHEASSSLLVLHVPNPSVQLETFVLNEGKPELASDAMAQVGASLARVHQTAPDELARLFSFVPAKHPMVWSFPQTLSRRGTPRDEAFHAFVRDAAFFGNVSRLSAVWDAQKDLLHGDLQWTNVLVYEEGDEARAMLVNWDCAALGDAAWDIAAHASEQVRLKVATNAISFEDVHDAWRAFWTAYASPDAGRVERAREYLPFLLVLAAHRTAALAGAAMPHSSRKLLDLALESASDPTGFWKEWVGA